MLPLGRVRDVAVLGLATTCPQRNEVMTMTQMFSWFDDWRDADLACTCGWSGRLDKRYGG